MKITEANAPTLKASKELVEKIKALLPANTNIVLLTFEESQFSAPCKVLMHADIPPMLCVQLMLMTSEQLTLREKANAEAATKAQEQNEKN